METRDWDEAARRLDLSITSLARELVRRVFGARPELETRYGMVGRAAMLRDALALLESLASALALHSAAMFREHVCWSSSLLETEQRAWEDIAFQLGELEQMLRIRLEPGAWQAACKVLHEAKRGLAANGAHAGDLGHEQLRSLLARRFLLALLDGRKELAYELVDRALEGGARPVEVYLNVFEATLREVGRLWQLGRVNVAQEHYCTATTTAIMNQLHPRWHRAPQRPWRALVTAVHGDLHELGPRMISDLLELDGWSTRFLGANTPNAAIVEELLLRPVDLVALSATIGPHVRTMRALVAMVRRYPELSGVRILVGGRPFALEPRLWEVVGADGWAVNAAQGVQRARELMEAPPAHPVPHGPGP